MKGEFIPLVYTFYYGGLFYAITGQLRIQEFPLGGANLIEGGTDSGWLSFEKFVCQNERAWIVGGWRGGLVACTSIGSATTSVVQN